MELPDYLHGIASESVQHECEANRIRRCWAVALGLQIRQDGDQFCILWGEDLQVGVAGFGKTPAAAIEAFEHAMYEPAKVPPKKLNPKVVETWNKALAALEVEQ